MNGGTLLTRGRCAPRRTALGEIVKSGFLFERRELGYFAKHDRELAGERGRILVRDEKPLREVIAERDEGVAA